ncbi:glycosyltransferase family 4 protein [Alkalihalobacterium sp. APHAB7]|uniref:glycosyltransferase family 4 protein n=1 Tax=Alkalihalobacterium sp. APHAB7 TaxID=3402081 RepID=UPI003AB03F4C
MIKTLKRIFLREKNELNRFAKENNKVCMVVWNTFETDARVTKEAVSVQKMDKEVTVIAVFEPTRTKKREVKDGINIIRVDRTIIKKKERANVTRSSNNTNVNSTTTKANHSLKNSVKKLLKPLYAIIPKTMINTRFFIRAFNEKAGIYHSHDLNTLVPTYLVSRIRGAKLIYDAHEVSTDRAGWKNKRFWTRIEKYIIRRADGVITTNDTRADYFAEEYGIEKPVVIRNVPPYQKIVSSDKLREEYGMIGNEPIIIYQGGIQRERGLENIIECIPLVRKGVFVFIGNGALKPKIMAKAKELGVEHRTIFHGAVPNEELLSYTASADLGLQLLQNTCFNHYSACSNKIHEYLMAGIPVVSSDLPELRKVVSSGNIGILVDPENIQMIAGAINQLIEDKDLYNMFKSNTVNAALGHHWGLEEEKLQKLYQ